MNTDPLKMARFSGSAHAILRITAGLTYLSHGTMKLLGFPAAPPDLPPMPVPLFSFMGFAGTLELIGGLLVMIGLFTRPAAFILSGQMAVAYWLAHASGGYAPASNGGEAAYLFCFVFLWLAAAGAGPWSVDNRSSN